MRALLGLLCFFWGSPAERGGDDVEALRSERVSEYRAVIAAIAPESLTRKKEAVRDLPEDLQKALDAWIDG